MRIRQDRGAQEERRPREVLGRACKAEDAKLRGRSWHPRVSRTRQEEDLHLRSIEECILRLGGFAALITKVARATILVSETLSESERLRHPKPDVNNLHSDEFHLPVPRNAAGNLCRLADARTVRVCCQGRTQGASPKLHEDIHGSIVRISSALRIQS